MALCFTVGAFSACDLSSLAVSLPEFSSSESESSSSESESSPEDSEPEETPPAEKLVEGDMTIHFLHLGNASPGDCTLIKVGNTEVLIDAGSTTGSCTTIVPYIRKYCTDGVLEYVIATHADSDHISAFVGTSNSGIFDSFACGTIIDFPRTDKDTQILKDYQSLRDKEVRGGATHYTALECYNGENGAARSYTLGEGITMNFLYQEFYETKTSDENDYSVCMLLTQGENNYLFTGDLEHRGEASLIANNELPQCKLFKGGHHGSATSTTTALLEKIRPEIICVCTCCGDGKYNFPAQEFIDRIANYTDKVYVTTMRSSSGAGVPLNGNIVVVLREGVVSVECSKNNTLFKDTTWLKNNRTIPSAWQTTGAGID